MRILVENGCYHLRNVGDVAMLQVAVRRLSSLWPDASIEVVTDEPGLLEVLCPGAKPVAVHGRRIWFKEKNVFGPRLYKYLPKRITHFFLYLERLIRKNLPFLAKNMIRLRRSYHKADVDVMSGFLDALFEADLLAVSGGGDLNDWFIRYANTQLDELQMAASRGIPTAMFGQGIGPIQNQRLRKRAMEVLPSVDLICIRERRAGPSLLKSIGVSSHRIVITGDDAIELAYNARRLKPGAAIGVNLRVSEASEVSDTSTDIVRDVLHDVGKNYNANLISLPISFHHADSDIKAIEDLLNVYDDQFSGNPSLINPLDIIKRVGLCRVVVTGSYHSAVFALAQGIPVVGLAKSAYYIDKLHGLADLFGTGCEVVSLGSENLKKELIVAIESAWQSAEQVKPELLKDAAQQIQMGLAAYQRLIKMIESRVKAA